MFFLHRQMPYPVNCPQKGNKTGAAPPISGICVKQIFGARCIFTEQSSAPAFLPALSGGHFVWYKSRFRPSFLCKNRRCRSGSHPPVALRRLRSPKSHPCPETRHLFLKTSQPSPVKNQLPCRSAREPADLCRRGKTHLPYESLPPFFHCIIFKIPANKKPEIRLRFLLYHLEQIKFQIIGFRHIP